MAYENSAEERLFNPEQVGTSLSTPIPIEGHWLSGLLTGEIISHQKGRGTSRDGTHDYLPGDDVRLIDQKATAGSPDGAIIVRDYFKDITPTLYIATDVLKTRSEVNPGICSEQLIGISAIAALMRTADLEGIPTSLIAAGDHSMYIQKYPNMGKPNLIDTGHDITTLIDQDLPMSNSSQGIKRRAGRIEQPQLGSEREIMLSDVIRRVGKLARTSWSGKESAILVVSDFRDEAEPDITERGWKSEMRKLSKQGHLLMALEVTNPDDFEIPEGDVDLSTKATKSWIGGSKRYSGREKRLDKLSLQRRSLYAELTAKQQIEIDRILGRLTIGHIKTSTESGHEPGEWLSDIGHQLKRISKQR